MLIPIGFVDVPTPTTPVLNCDAVTTTVPTPVMRRSLPSFNTVSPTLISAPFVSLKCLMVPCGVETPCYV